jgi:hypothetical protein
MKLTKDIEKEIDKLSLLQISSMFRFHPTDITSGESGRYMQEAALKKIMEDKKELSDEQRKKVFRIA